MIWLLLVFGSASIVFITDNDAVEGFFALFSIIGLIGWIKHVKRRAEEGGNWLSNKPSVEEIVRQQLAEEESGLPHIIIDPSKLTNRIAHADHEFDFLCSRCGSLSGDLISRATHTREDPRSLSNVIQGAVTVLLFMIPHLLRWFDDDNEIMVCNDCGNQSRF